MANPWRSITAGLDSLLYPQLCLACERTLDTAQGHFICAGCSASLPFTQHHELIENELTDRLAGRTRLVFGGALFYYQPESAVQRMIHAFKYYHRPDIALKLGEFYGKRLKNIERLKDLNAIIPVPLHPQRQLERGYNQAERLGAGIAKRLDLPQFADGLKRLNFGGSQTRKGSLERLENVSNSFEVNPVGTRTGLRKLKGQHILLVDDVLTTGATLDLCAEALTSAFPDLRISIATVAMVM